MADNFKLDIDADGIALITWDMPGRSMNVIDLAAIEELSAIVEKIAADAAIKGAVVTSGKETFCAGADLTLLETLTRTFGELAKSKGDEAAATVLFAESRKLSQLYRRIETCGKPFVAAINGTALGGGFELCLACHQRIAADNDKTRLGLPEVKIGLFPGAGGTQRIARMMAPADALQFLLKGDQLRLNRAKSMKLVDAVVPAGDLIKTAKDWAKANPKAKAPWDVEGFRLPGGQVYSKAGMMTFPAANAIYRRETFDNYPAARAIMQVVYEGLLLPIDRALTVESRYFAKILRSPEAAAMIRSLFVSMQDINKGARRPANMPQAQIKKVGILGAGFMGAGIASVSAQAGIEVVLIDRDQESADKGKAHVQQGLTDQVNKGRATAAQRDATLGAHHRDRRLRGARRRRPHYRGGVRGSQGEGRGHRQGAGGGARCDLRVQHLDPADHLACRERQGPGEVHRHPLLLAGRAHDAGRDHHGQEHRRRGAGAGAGFRPHDPQDPDRRQRLARLLHLARGRHLSREGHLMLAEGIPAAMIENVGRMAGMPVGPLSLNDEVAVDLAWKIVKATEADLGASAIDLRQKALLEFMVEKKQRLGRKNGKGFYDYPEKGPKKLWPGLAEMQSTKLDPDTIDVQELKDRFLAMQALETARCFEEGVLTDVREADVGSILGFGFAPFSGGTLSYIDMMGVQELRRAVPAPGEEVRVALCAGEAAARDGAEGREFLWALRAGKKAA